MPPRSLLAVPAAVHPHQPTDALFDILLIVHVALALAGVASVVASAVFALWLGRTAAPSRQPVGPPARSPGAAGSLGGDDAPLAAGSPEPETSALARYYAPGANWLGRMLYGVPVVGVALIAASEGYATLAHGWLLGGIMLWVVVIALGEGVVWPAERRLQGMVGEPGGGGAATPGGRDVVTTSRIVLAGSLAMFATLVAAFVVMTARP